ncbi:MAG TPA: acyl-CoA dehydrogenase [Gammaproteobacteria bacterium]|nr:acyl-CoA dehydrogenase [Gammaproteobacteria bacterium]
MEFSLSSEQEMIIDTVRSFVEQELYPHEDEVEKTNHIDVSLAESIKQKAINLGLYATNMPVEYGGGGLDTLTLCLLEKELGKANFGLQYIVARPSNILMACKDEQIDKYLLPTIRGEKVDCLAMTEPNAGSDVVSMKTSATKTNGGYLLNGSKMWITNAPDADIFIVYAKTDTQAGKNGITAFLIEKDTPGFEVGSPLDKLGMRASKTAPLYFKDCFVADDHILGEVNKGVKVLMSGLDYERLVLAAGPLGIMQAALDIALPYTRERQQFNQRIGDFELVQGKLADMYTRLNSTRAYIYTIAAAADRGESTRKDAAACILLAAENATQCALDAIQLLGGNGYINEYATGQLLRDAKLYEIGAGTSEIRRMLIGRELVEDTAR